MIRTKEFPFTKQQYFNILFIKSFRRNVWTIIFLIGIFLYQASKGFSQLVMFLGALPVLYISYLMIRSWIHTSSKKNKNFFQKRRFEIDDKQIEVIFPDGLQSTIMINNIARVVKNRSYYLLFLSKRQFVYVPINAFKTQGDINRFDSILKARKWSGKK